MTSPPKGPPLNAMQKELIKLLAVEAAQQFLKEQESPAEPLPVAEKAVTS